ncbi:uncharacterized protein LOC129706906 [Leucoraja erinacea]|uniref:uncharacterized protein LOC129706906 n=1 Tax=Leucoraja erinaceus TaxID=7782 RepID=UPI002458127F|nr:uncharacterized protein LOC129706906 [Leucoraja erinacea]
MTCASCRICAELKPRFFHPEEGRLIKGTQPMERLSIDFKGPLPSSSQNVYILTIVDEYLRFPFAFPCPNMSAAKVIKCLDQLFSFCGFPSYIHSDRGTSFMSKDLKDYLCNRRIAISKTTPYHPIGNGQVERYNGIIWKAVKLALKLNDIPDQQWECVLPDALHSIRSLLSTATNTPPHKRFFNFKRCSSSGTSLPSWLTSPGPVLLHRYVRSNKNEPFVDEVELTDVNPSYATIKYQDVSQRSHFVTLHHVRLLHQLRHFLITLIENFLHMETSIRNSKIVNVNNNMSEVDDQAMHVPPAIETPLSPEAPVLRRSSRRTKPPYRLNL